ncbi:MAG TPA: helix-turn-helix transcriptional regulator [Desulfosarcina sp.]|nr:helix-turn-helix transcriptional regulator [Desulfosarcina sp.]
MKIEEVPQDPGMITGDRREICYAVDDRGNYVMTGSAGWEPKNIANRQAWELIDEAAARILGRVHAGKASPLAYHMARHQMSAGLLAKYAGINRLKIWLHLKPGPFSRLKSDVLQRYADIFDMPVADLKAVPEVHRTGSGNE